jgi:hypothetical protein
MLKQMTISDPLVARRFSLTFWVFLFVNIYVFIAFASSGILPIASIEWILVFVVMSIVIIYLVIVIHFLNISAGWFEKAVSDGDGE